MLYNKAIVYAIHSILKQDISGFKIKKIIDSKKSIRIRKKLENTCNMVRKTHAFSSIGKKKTESVSPGIMQK